LLPARWFNFSLNEEHKDDETINKSITSLFKKSFRESNVYAPIAGAKMKKVMEQGMKNRLLSKMIKLQN